jgi:hypothetical protein
MGWLNKIRLKAGSCMICDNPEEGASYITKNMEDGFLVLVRWYGDRSKGKATSHWEQINQNAAGIDPIRFG